MSSEAIPDVCQNPSLDDHTLHEFVCQGPSSNGTRPTVWSPFNGTSNMARFA